MGATKSPDEAYEIYLIDRMSTADRMNGLREDVRKACLKWLAPLPLREKLESLLSEGDGNG